MKKEKNIRYPKINKFDVQENYPLSLQQERVLYVSLLNQESPIWNRLSCKRILGQLDIDALQNTLLQLIKRHAALGIRIRKKGKQYVQYFTCNHIAKITELDFSNFSPAEANVKLKEFTHNENKIPIQLLDSDLFEVKYIKLPEDESALILKLHHIISDATTLQIIWGDIRKIYNSYNKEIYGDEAIINYQDYLLWQKNNFNTEQIEEENYWLEEFKGNLPKLKLPFDFIEQDNPNFSGKDDTLTLRDELAASLNSFSFKNKVIPFSTLFSAFYLLLYKYSQQNEIVSGTVFSGRQYNSEIKKLVGFFINIVGIKIKFDSSTTITEFIKYVHKKVEQAHAMQDYSLEKLIHKLNPERSGNKNPLFNVAFNMINSYKSEDLFINTKGEEFIEVESNRSEFDLFMEIENRFDTYNIRLEYNDYLFKKETVSQMLKQYNILLKEIIKNPNQCIEDTSFIDDSEFNRLVYEWNKTDREYSHEKLIHQLFEEQVQKEPNNTAISIDSKNITYSELNDRANKLANFLIETGVSEAEKIAVYIHRSVDAVVSLLGILKAGAAYVPLEKKWPEQRLQDILVDLNIRKIIVASNEIRTINEIQWELPNVQDIIVVDVLDQELPTEVINKNEIASFWDYVSDNAHDTVSSGGFVSSYTGEPFKLEEVEEYQNHIVNIVRSHINNDSSVLEIGCGSGLILFPLSEYSKKYVGIDPSERTLNRIESIINAKQINNIQLKNGFAHEVKNLCSDSYDMIICASTVQFFPGYIYLDYVIKDALKLLKPGGKLLLADIMDKTRKNEFINSLYDFEMNSNVSNKTKTNFDNEFFVHPEYFDSLKDNIPCINHVNIIKREVGFDNELGYRYDVIIEKNYEGIVNDINQASYSNKNFYTSHHLNTYPISNPDIQINSSNDAYVIFTSGSTGKPKGVVVKHKPVINVIEWVNKKFSVNDKDKLLFLTSLSFDLSVYDIFGVLAAGACIRLVQEHEMKNPENLIGIIDNENITIWDSAPAAIQQIIPLISKDSFKANSTLKYILLSGDWIPVKLPSILEKAYLNAEVISLGGATEATIWSNYYRFKEDCSKWPSVPYGKPIQNAKYYILDENLKPQPIGICGDLYIGGDCLASGYINDQELTDDKFILNPFVKGEEVMYQTGDLARWLPDGNMQFLGRRDHQVKVRGYRIELGEIENVLSDHPKITSSVANTYGTDNNKAIACYYVKKVSEQVSNVELMEYLRRKLPVYMLPSVVMEIDTIPMNKNGKIDRTQLPNPHNCLLIKRDIIEEPHNAIEIKVLDIVKQLLNVELDSINDNFFSLGGNSLSIIQLISEIEDEFDISISIEDLIDLPTLKVISERVRLLIEESENNSKEEKVYLEI